MVKKLLYCAITVIVIIFTLVSCGGEKVPEHVHVYGEWALRKIATCAEAGRETRYCDCGERETREIPKTSDHKWVDATEEHPKTCSVCGATEGEPLTRVDVNPTDTPMIPYQ